MNAEVERIFTALYEKIEDVDGAWRGHHQGQVLTSAFQPVYSLPHRRPVGYEGLIRINDAQGRNVPPMQLFERVRDFDEQVMLDRLCRLLHARNFARQTGHDSWLFLNIHPAVFLGVATNPDTMLRAAQGIQRLGLQMSRLVFEVTEDVMASDQSFELAAERARSTGCLLALDDFGAGHSNFDRVWRIRPEIVKLDRSLLQRAMASRRMARMLNQMVALLHECGAMVLLEGIETEDEAHLALDADVDLVQGYAFGRPQARLLPDVSRHQDLESAWGMFDGRHVLMRRAHDERIAPYKAALDLAAQALRAGQSLVQASADLLKLEHAQLCYLLDEHGTEIGNRATPAERPLSVDPRFEPLKLAGEARWARRPYFRRAIASVGEMQVTRPYLSLHSAGLCVTLSVAFWRDGRLQVLCSDIDWIDTEAGL